MVTVVVVWSLGKLIAAATEAIWPEAPRSAGRAAVDGRSRLPWSDRVILGLDQAGPRLTLPLGPAPA